MMAKYGDKIKGDPTSFGNDVYMSTGEFEEPSGFIHAGRPSDFGIAIYQGNLTDINYLQLNIGYLINPATNFKIDFSIVKRDLVSEEQEVNTMFYSIGLKTDLFNHYYDFQFFFLQKAVKLQLNIFKESLNNMISELRHSPSIDPNLPVLVAGDPEKISEKIRTKEGIPLDEDVINDFNSTITDHSLMQQFKSCFI